ncbi:DNA N-6-adenine-methyltransferase [Allorhizobium undicola]|uniref:DNA N-6-adenine-methyltransferase n=1 Tax=Allorhizobium undicola TaxID=78527 RepID=UPI000A001C9C|nr:DNA N-6-adenine-methyltransferase [Allorhizobium undicola]
MAYWEAVGRTDEWYTPKYIFDALGCDFDLDVASPCVRRHVPARCWLTRHDDGLKYAPFWHGMVWMNPPFGGRNGLIPWLNAFVRHGNGIALFPDRTSAPWFQTYAPCMDALLFVSPKVQFERPDGTVGASPGTGTVLAALGTVAVRALYRASDAGIGWIPGRKISHIVEMEGA